MFLDLPLRLAPSDEHPKPLFQFFGPQIVRSPEVPNLGQKERQVLAILAITARRIVPLETLYAELWSGGQRPRTYAATLNSSMMTLRQKLGERTRARHDQMILTTPNVGYMLNVPDDEIDALLFGKLAQQASASLGQYDFEEVLRVLGRAFSVAWGELFWSIECGPLLLQFRQELEMIGEGALLTYYRSMLALKRHRECVTGLQLQWKHRPRREDMAYLAMLALALCDRWDDALAVYRETRRELFAASNSQPGSRLAALQLRLLNKDPLLLEEAATLAVA